MRGVATKQSSMLSLNPRGPGALRPPLGPRGDRPPSGAKQASGAQRTNRPPLDAGRPVKIGGRQSRPAALLNTLLV